jgi:hypothetical protein
VRSLTAEVLDDGPGTGSYGSERESVKACVFGGFLQGRRVGPPMLPYLPTCVIGNVFEPFMILFMSELAAISFCAQSPNRSVHGGPARYKTASPDRELLCPKGLRKSADPPVRDRIGKHPPSNQSLTSASQGFCRNLAGKSKGQEGLGSVTIASNQVAIPTAHGCKTHPLNPAVSGFRNPRQLSTFTNSPSALSRSYHTSPA